MILDEILKFNQGRVKGVILIKYIFAKDEGSPKNGDLRKSQAEGVTKEPLGHN